MGDDVDLVRIQCGTDRFAAETYAARCRFEGLRVELMSSDGHGLLNTPLVQRPFVLLVRAEDADAVRSIVEDDDTSADKQRRLARARRRRTGR
ncbi:MAG: hypothetical protein U5K30_03770 [Acidimicrobiales bacterium]|nr:hypothetical protein [Acidimicrobiales bacterium]